MRKTGGERNKTGAIQQEMSCSPEVIVVVDINRNILVLQRNMECVFLSPEWLGRIVHRCSPANINRSNETAAATKGGLRVLPAQSPFNDYLATDSLSTLR